MLLNKLILGLIILSPSLIFPLLQQANILKNPWAYDFLGKLAHEVACNDSAFSITADWQKLEEFGDIFKSCGEYYTQPGDNEIFGETKSNTLKCSTC